MVDPLGYVLLVYRARWCDGSSDRSFMVDPLGYVLLVYRARCSSVVRAFMMGRWIDPSWSSTTGLTIAVVCTILSVEWCI